MGFHKRLEDGGMWRKLTVVWNFPGLRYCECMNKIAHWRKRRGLFLRNIPCHVISYGMFLWPICCRIIFLSSKSKAKTSRVSKTPSSFPNKRVVSNPGGDGVEEISNRKQTSKVYSTRELNNLVHFQIFGQYIWNNCKMMYKLQI